MLTGDMAKGKLARLRTSIANANEKTKEQQAAILGGGAGWWIAGFIGDKMAKDEQEGTEPTFELFGKAIPKYEAGSAAVLAYAGLSKQPKGKSANVRIGVGYTAAAALGAAHGVRKYKFRLENPAGE